MKRQPTQWEDIFTKDTSDKGLTLKIYEELIKLNKKANNAKCNQPIRERQILYDFSCIWNLMDKLNSQVK